MDLVFSDLTWKRDLLTIKSDWEQARIKVAYIHLGQARVQLQYLGHLYTVQKKGPLCYRWENG